MDAVKQEPVLARLAATISATLDRIESHKRALIVATVTIVLLNVSFWAFHVAVAGDLGWRLGVDYRLYMFATDRWLHGAGFYQLWQLTGPYPIPTLVGSLPDLPVLYPPVAIPLFLPWALLPVLWPLWWAIPLGIIAACVIRMRPRVLLWPVLAIFAVSTEAIWLTLSGNPIMWAAAAFATGLLVGWPAVFVLLKPTMAPFALLGIGRRTWWMALAVLVAASVPFGSMWLDWIAAVRNSGGDIAYGLNNVPLFLCISIAWLGRRPDKGTHGTP